MTYKIKTDHIAITDGVDGYFGGARVYTEYGGLVPPPPPPSVGTLYGFTSGGQIGLTASTDYVNTVDRFPFSTPFATANDIGDLSQIKQQIAGQNSETNGYTTGGLTFVAPTTPTVNSTVNTIDRFPFSTPFTTATDIGDLSSITYRASGVSSADDGYTTGGTRTPSGSTSNTIDRFPFSTPFTTATDIGDLSAVKYSTVGISSPDNGFTVGGSPPPSSLNTIDRFPFSTPFVTATDAGDLSAQVDSAAGHTSGTNGFTSGGTNTTTTISKFPFSTPLSSSTVGSLTSPVYSLSGQSSSTDGYSSGGFVAPSLTFVNTIQRFSFTTSPVTASDIADLSSVRGQTAGQQD